jgi:hypothetical protein
MKRILLWIVGPLTLISLIALLFLYYASYSEGVRAGTVIKLSKKGVVFKTWEGQLSLNSFGAVKSDNQLSEVFEFSVEKGQDSLYHELEEVSLSGERINLYYVERYAILPWRGSTKYFVEKVDRSGQVPDNKKRFPVQP